jgi:hypothetical protein
MTLENSLSIAGASGRVFEENFLSIDGNILEKLQLAESFEEEHKLLKDLRIIRSPYPERNVRTKIIFDYFFREIHLVKELLLSLNKAKLYMDTIQSVFRYAVLDNPSLSKAEAVEYSKNKVFF